MPPFSAAVRAKVITRPETKRSALLNAGAEAATGQVLLFLWPGTRLPPNALAAIERNLALLPPTVGGNFHVKFDDDSLFARVLKRFLKRWRYRGRYYGHSAIFARRAAFEALGGFKPHKILEDYDFARRMEQYGPTLYLPETVVASARKFTRQKIKATAIWSIIQILFMLGLSPDRLAHWWVKE